MTTLTFEQFRDGYRKWRSPFRSQLRYCVFARQATGRYKETRFVLVDFYRLAFVCHFRVPNRAGFFGTGPDAVGARWCWPWQWYRRYYEARVLVS